MLSALWFGASHPAVSVVVVAGAVLFVVGFSLRLWAVFTLGRYYSHEVRILADHAVVNSGPYRLLRHPAYTGMIMAHLGVLVMFFNSVTLALFCCAFLPLIVLRIFVEERVLMSVNGYAAFSAGRKRLVPFVW
jgi:protein-S-isoprenylcysteine O-methyltransferase Ste14